MGRTSKIKTAKPVIEEFFQEESLVTVFRFSDLGDVLDHHCEEWGLPANLYTPGFVKFLLSEAILKEIVLQAKSHKAKETRYIRGRPSPYAVAVSLRRNAYLCHGSAVFLHGLTGQIPKTVFV